MLRRRFLALAAGVAGVTLGLAACSSGTDAPQSTPSSSAQFPVTVGTVTLDKQPTKIVSLGPTATEMLFAIGAGKQVSAADDLSNYPADAPKTDLQAFKPNAEAIAAKNPDLVVLTNDTN